MLSADLEALSAGVIRKPFEKGVVDADRNTKGTLPK